MQALPSSQVPPERGSVLHWLVFGSQVSLLHALPSSHSLSSLQPPPQIGSSLCVQAPVLASQASRS